MEQVHWKRRGLLVLRMLFGLALISTGFFYINRSIDEYAVPFFVDNFSPHTLKTQIKAEKKSFGLFFKRKKKSKQSKEITMFEDAIRREFLLSVCFKVCVGGMLLFIGFLILFLYLGIESIVIGWLLAVQAGYEAYIYYDFGTFMRYKEPIGYASLIGAMVILILFLFEYTQKYKEHMISGHNNPNSMKI